MNRLFSVAILALLAGCAATDMRDRGWEDRVTGKAERLLIQGLNQYEEANYKKSGESLNAALTEGLAFKKDRVTAHKYLAFIDCAAGREATCREQFAAALALDPDLELSPAEAGHPMWGNVFKSVKTRIARAK
ncbi:MAG TPA: TssQ family T6SS-associated lipoprotein [Burkholderiales bacterium]|jgi:Tfp pilus assembly protein PilF|nr:TssQ family T6SS-associated lipoprotein [Burkholderiales bacterium]